VRITCHDLDNPLKSIRYWGGTVMNLDAQGMMDILAIRWEVETFFEYEKDLLGSDHYQVMTHQGVLRFWPPTACLQCFFEELRSQESNSTLTCGDVRRNLQQEVWKIITPVLLLSIVSKPNTGGKNL